MRICQKDADVGRQLRRELELGRLSGCMGSQPELVERGDYGQ